MKKLFFVLAFICSFSYVNSTTSLNIVSDEIVESLEVVNNLQVSSNIISFSDDHCTVTVTIKDGEGNVLSSATWTDNTGNCRVAQAGAAMMAFSLMAG